MDKKSFGKRLQAARKNKGLTSEKLAEIVDLSHGFIIEIERGNRLPSLPVFIQIAETLEVTPDYLLRDSNIQSETHVLNELLQHRINDLTKEQFYFVSDIIQTLLKHF